MEEGVPDKRDRGQATSWGSGRRTLGQPHPSHGASMLPPRSLPLSQVPGGRQRRGRGRFGARAQGAEQEDLAPVHPLPRDLSSDL